MTNRPPPSSALFFLLFSFLLLISSFTLLDERRQRIQQKAGTVPGGRNSTRHAAIPIASPETTPRNSPTSAAPSMAATISPVLLASPTPSLPTVLSPPNPNVVFRLLDFRLTRHYQPNGLIFCQTAHGYVQDVRPGMDMAPTLCTGAWKDGQDRDPELAMGNSNFRLFCEDSRFMVVVEQVNDSTDGIVSVLRFEESEAGTSVRDASGVNLHYLWLDKERHEPDLQLYGLDRQAYETGTNQRRDGQSLGFFEQQIMALKDTSVARHKVCGPIFVNEKSREAPDRSRAWSA